MAPRNNAVAVAARVPREPCLFTSRAIFDALLLRAAFSAELGIGAS